MDEKSFTDQFNLAGSPQKRNISELSEHPQQVHHNDGRQRSLETHMNHMMKCIVSGPVSVLWIMEVTSHGSRWIRTEQDSQLVISLSLRLRLFSKHRRSVRGRARDDTVFSLRHPWTHLRQRLEHETDGHHHEQHDQWRQETSDLRKQPQSVTVRLQKSRENYYLSGILSWLYETLSSGSRLGLLLFFKTYLLSFFSLNANTKQCPQE